MTPFETFKKACQTELPAVLPQRVAAMDWSTDQLKVERAKDLQSLLKHTLNHSPWHQQRLQNIDLEMVTPDNMTALPTMTKTDVQENFDAISTDPKVTRAWCDQHLAAGTFYTDGSYCILASGGSSGQPGMQVYDARAAMQFGATNMRAGLRYSIRHGLPRADPRQQFWIVAAAGAAHPTRVLPPCVGISGENLWAVTNSLEDIIAALNTQQPIQVMMYSSFLGRLIEAQLTGQLKISPEVISLTSETPNPLDIARAKDVFGCRISSTWASMEFGTMGLSSQFEDGHLLSDDVLIIEAVDEHGEAVAPGQKASKILITNLYNTTVPLIRYELTDQITIYDRPAVCGSNLRAASWVEGRSEDHFVYRSGASNPDIHVHAHLFRHVLEHTPNIVEYQVRQTERGADIDLLPNNDSAVDVDQLRQTLVTDLENIGLGAAQVTVSLVPSIGRTSAQKLRRFVPLPQS